MRLLDSSCSLLMSEYPFFASILRTDFFFLIQSFLMAATQFHNWYESIFRKTQLLSLFFHTSDTEMAIDANISVAELIATVDLTKFYRYKGSLTTPLCNEVVLWTVFHEPINVNKSLVSPKRLFFFSFYDWLILHEAFCWNIFGFFYDTFNFTRNQNRKLWTE